MKSWVKVYTEINHDPKMGALTWAQRGIWTALLALAGELDDRDDEEGETGALDTLECVAWRIRCDPAELAEAVAQFTKHGMMTEVDGILVIVNYARRQGRAPSTKRSRVAERVKRYRDAQQETGNEDVTTLKRGVTPPDTDTDTDSDSDTEEMQNSLHPANAGADAPPPVAASKPKPRATKAAKKPPTPSQEMFTALAKACSIDLAMITPGQRGALNQTERMLRDAGVKPEQIAAFREWWNREDWRGKRGDAPEPHQVREEWGRYLDGSKPAPKSPSSVAVRVYE